MVNQLRSGLLVAVLASASTALTASPAYASDTVSYTITSDSINHLDVEYVDQSGRHLLQGVTLPWHLDVTLANAQGPTGVGAQVRADWRPIARPGQWVVASISSNGKLLCQSTLDLGNATCYGNTPHIS